MQKHLELLGKRVEDRVTGIKGVVTSISFDLFGCICATINPGLDKDGKHIDSHWYDVSRLKITSEEPVMKRPNFETGPQARGEQGAAEKQSIGV